MKETSLQKVELEKRISKEPNQNDGIEVFLAAWLVLTQLERVRLPPVLLRKNKFSLGFRLRGNKQISTGRLAAKISLL